MDGTASTRSSAGRLSHGGGDGTGTTALRPKLQLLPWLHEGGDPDDDLTGLATMAEKKAGKKRRWTAHQASLARGVKALLSEVAEMISTKFERSIPAAKFGHVAYIR